MYKIPSSTQIIILAASLLARDPPPVGWTAFQEKTLWLGIKISLYPFIRKFLAISTRTRPTDAKWVEVPAMFHPNMQRAWDGVGNDLSLMRHMY